VEDSSPSRVTFGAALVRSASHCFLTPEGTYGKSRYTVLGNFMVGKTISIIKRSDKEV